MKKFLIWLSGMIALPFVTLFIAMIFVKALGFSIETATSFLDDSRDTDMILGVWGILSALSALGWTGCFIDLSDTDKKPQLRSGPGIACDFCGKRSTEPFINNGCGVDICSDCASLGKDK